MKTKNENANQKERILKAAQKLFYEKGYVNTYFDQIAEICGITKPLISYYFKSKSALARAVTERYMTDVKNSVAFSLYEYVFRFRNYDLQVSTAVEIKITDKLFFDDENVKRFYQERAKNSYYDLISGSSRPMYEIHDRKYHLPINPNNDEISMLAQAAAAATSALRLAFMSGKFNCTYDEYSDYMTSVHFKMMNISKERIEEILLEANKILAKLKFSPIPYFGIHIEPSGDFSSEA